MTTATPKPRWYHLTPDRFIVGLLAVLVFLFLSQWFQWFWLNEQKGWTVLIAVAVVGVAVVVMLAWGLVCLCLRRRFQFGVRSLLLFVVAMSLPLGWFASEMQRARRQSEVLAVIGKLGGDVSYDYHFDKNRKRPGPTWLRKLLGDDFFCDVVQVIFANGYFDDRAMTNSNRHYSFVSDLDMVGDEDLDGLVVLSTLRELYLERSHITDAGMERLKGLTNLVTLDLSHTYVTDTGLQHLAELTKLECLDISNTPVTDAGVEKLREAVPNCEIMEVEIEYEFP